MSILSPFQIKTEIKFESFAIADPSEHTNAILRVFGKKATQSASAFPKMSRQEMNVWKAYCPQIESLDKTDVPIHANALSIIEATKAKEMFHIYEIWSEAEEQIDPVLVGVRLKASYSDQKGGMKELLAGSRYENQNDYFLLCRWGESLKPYEEIKKIGFTQKVGKRKIQLNQTIKQAQRDLEDLEDAVREELGYYETN